MLDLPLHNLLPLRQLIRSYSVGGRDFDHAVDHVAGRIWVQLEEGERDFEQQPVRVAAGVRHAWIDPPSKALIARYAPQSVNGTMFAMSALAGAFGFFALGYLGRFYEPLGASLYFLLTALMPVTGAVMMLIFAGPIQRLLDVGESSEGAPERAEPLTA